MRISVWSSDVCSSDLPFFHQRVDQLRLVAEVVVQQCGRDAGLRRDRAQRGGGDALADEAGDRGVEQAFALVGRLADRAAGCAAGGPPDVVRPASCPPACCPAGDGFRVSAVPWGRKDLERVVEGKRWL